MCVHPNRDLSFSVEQDLHGHGCKIFYLPAIHRKKRIAVSQSDIIRAVIHGDSVRDWLWADTLLPMAQDTHIDQEGHDHIDRHATQHDDQALPGGLERNSQGCGSCLSCSVSMLSSTMPDILTYPPKGSHPMPYSVSPTFFLARENHGSKRGRTSHPCFEEPGRNEVPHLVQDDQQRQTQNELGDLYKSLHGARSN